MKMGAGFHRFGKRADYWRGADWQAWLGPWGVRLNVDWCGCHGWGASAWAGRADGEWAFYKGLGQPRD